MSYFNQYVIIDDDPTSLLICEFIIRKFDKDADIKLYNRPEDALDQLKDYSKKNHFEVVLFLDLNMPTMSGWEFLNQYDNLESIEKKRFSIYILSSSLEDFSIELNKYSYVSGVLAKPFRSDYLLKILEEKSTAVETLTFTS